MIETRCTLSQHATSTVSEYVDCRACLFSSSYGISSLATCKHAHKGNTPLQDPTRHQKLITPRRSRIADHDLEERLLRLALSVLVTISTTKPIVDRLLLDLLGLARRLRLLSRTLAIGVLASSSTLLRRGSLRSLGLRRGSTRDVASLRGDLLLDLGPGVGSGDGVGHAGKGGEFLVVGL